MRFLQTLFILLFSTIAFAQKNTEKIVINTPGVQCESCKSLIEPRLQREYGVASVKVDFKKHTVTVVYIKDRTSPENIKTAIANMGYDAGDITADPDGLSRLPKTCRHPLTPAK